MLAGFVLSLREGLEMALVIGIVLGALQKVHRPELRPAVWSGAVVAAVISLLVAILLSLFGAELEGNAESVFEGVTFLLAAGVLTWMIFWMSRQARGLKSELETGVRRAVLQSGTHALFLLAFIAVLKEGIELALFLTAAVFASGETQVVAGSLFGLGAAALLGWSLFASILHLDLRRFFQVTGLLLFLFAAGLVAQSVHAFNELGWVPAVIQPVWDLGFLLKDQSFLGQVFSTLFGYSSQPSLTQVLAYAFYFGLIAVAQWVLSRPTTPKRQEA